MLSEEDRRLPRPRLVDLLDRELEALALHREGQDLSGIGVAAGISGHLVRRQGHRRRIGWCDQRRSETNLPRQRRQRGDLGQGGIQRRHRRGAPATLTIGEHDQDEALLGDADDIGMLAQGVSAVEEDPGPRHVLHEPVPAHLDGGPRNGHCRLPHLEQALRAHHVRGPRDRSRVDVKVAVADHVAGG